MKKITKTRARQMWLSGHKFWMVPCNMRIDSAFKILIDPMKANQDYTTFDSLYNAFLYYNCNRQTGMYPHFYTAD